jgi:hypothetical protein
MRSGDVPAALLTHEAIDHVEVGVSGHAENDVHAAPRNGVRDYGVDIHVDQSLLSSR